MSEPQAEYLKTRREHGDFVDLAGMTYREVSQLLLEAQATLDFGLEHSDEVDPILIQIIRGDCCTLRAELERRRNEEPEFVSSPKGINRAQLIFPLQTWAAFIDTNFDEQPFTIQGIAPESGLIAFHGRGKDGKTTLLIHCCRAVATGQGFLDKPTHQKPVVYLNYEMVFPTLKSC